MLKRQVIPRSRRQRHEPRRAAFGSATEVAVAISHSDRYLTTRYILITLLVISRSLSPANHLYWYHYGAGHGHVVKDLSVLGLRLCQMRVQSVVRPAVVRPAPATLVAGACITLVVGALVPLVVRTLCPTALSVVTASATLFAPKAVALVPAAATAASALSGREGVGLYAGLLKDVLVPHVGAMGLVVVELLTSLSIRTS